MMATTWSRALVEKGFSVASSTVLDTQDLGGWTRHLAGEKSQAALIAGAPRGKRATISALCQHQHHVVQLVQLPPAVASGQVGGARETFEREPERQKVSLDQTARPVFPRSRGA